MATPQQLKDALPRLSDKDRGFAESLLAGARRYGGFTAKQQYWVDVLYTRANEPKVERASVKVGELAGILALFAKARQHLKYPAIVLGCEGLGDDLRVSVFSSRSKHDGQLKVELANTYDFDERFGEKRRWVGRVDLDGVFQPGARTDAAKVGPALARFAAAPAEVAGEYGRLTGNCCFCRKPLSDERSTAVGYGAKCASNYGLPWGERPAAICEAVAA